MGMQGVIPPNIDYSKSVSDGYKKKIYKKGETCIKYNKLYQAKEDIDEPEEWNPEHWKETTVEQIRAQMQQEIEAVNTNIANITPDDTAVDGKPWTSKHIVDMLCPPLKVSGNPVQCYPVAGYPLGVKASWEPTQEGSGTPYPAGGGKNQLNPAEYEAATKTIRGITFTRLNTGEVVVNGTATGTAIYTLINNFSYAVSLSTDKNWSVVGENVISAQGLVSGVTILKPSDSTRLYIRVESGTAVKITVQPQIEKGNTPTAWAPYENIRPIKGRDSVKVERCGENILNPKAYNSITTNGITFTVNDDKSVHITGTSTGRAVFKLYSYQYKMSLPDGKYTFSTIANIPSGVGVLIGCYYKSELSAVYKKNLIVLGSGKSSSTVSLSGVEWLDGYIEVLSGNTVDITLYPMLVPGSTPPTTYTPYTGQTNTLTLPETVYGGEVDAVSGEGQDVWKLITLNGTETWESNSNNDRMFFETNVAEKYTDLPISGSNIDAAKQAQMCSHLTVGNPYSYDVDNCFWVYYTLENETARLRIRSTTNWTTSDELKSYLANQYAAGTPVQIAYKLVSPTAFSATGNTPVKALSGINTVLTDADSVEVTGREDLPHAIAGQ